MPLSESADGLSEDEWVQVFTPSEGEMGNKPEETKLVHTSTKTEAPTQPEDSQTTHTPAPNTSTSQGEPSKSSHSTRTANHSEHAHKPIIVDSTPSAPSDRAAPGKHPLTHQQVAKAPYQHMALDYKSGNPHNVLWFQALEELQQQVNAQIRDPNDVFSYDSTTVGNSFCRSSLPEHVLDCFLALHNDREDDLPCFNAWITRNYLTMTKPKETTDSNTPKWSDALKSNRKEDWLEALLVEFNYLRMQEVFIDHPWDLIPSGAQILTSGVVAKVKCDANGNELTLKAQIVVHGNRQIAGKSYDNTFFNTPDLAFIRLIFLIVAYADLDCHMVDVTGTYTHAPIDRPLYVEYPKGYGKKGPTVMKLVKALYGAHQSGCLWEQYRNAKILAIGYRPNQKDASIFTCMKDGIYSIIVCYVDDFVICCTAGHIETIKQEILALFDCKNLGKMKLFLGIAIKCDRARHTISLSMESYIKNIVRLADLENAAPAHTPMSNTQPILEPLDGKIEYPYITQIGRLFWIARCCWPDISFATAILARHSTTFGAPHINVLKRTHRYLLQTAHIGLTYDCNKPFYEVGYSDTDFASQHGRKSITGSVIMMGGAAVTWTSKKQTSVSLSTMEAEFIALCHTVKEILSIWQFLDDLGISHESSIPSPIFCNNQAVIEA
jgi:hypothetical protein